MVKSENHCGAFVDICDSGLSVTSSRKSIRNTPTLKQLGLITLCSEGADTVENYWDCSVWECEKDLL